MKRIRLLLLLLFIPLGAFLLFLLFASIDDYTPDEISELAIRETPDILPDSSIFDLLIWNIGYAGLDASMDFFYDGGEMVRPNEHGVQENLEGIRTTLSAYRDYDFILLQEVDRNSKRSYRKNQVELITADFKGFNGHFGLNYDVAFVPIPLGEPMGKVESGLLSLSEYEAEKTERYSFPGNYSWPMKLFMLDRCFLVERFRLSSGKQLLVINTHKSAYDDGSLRKEQMSFLKNFLLEEYGKGNYIIAGGDWNQTPNGMKPELPSHVFDTISLTYVEKDFPSTEWTWAYDPNLPTNRRVAQPYKQDTSPTTVIDYFLLSPNIKALEVETRDVDFRFSDHQPVRLKAQLQF